MINNRLTTIIASSTAAAVIIGVGAWSIGKSSNDNASASSTPAAQRSQAPPTGLPPAGARGFGTPVTGATATKIKAAVLAKYKGTVERVIQLPDGSYGVHVITTDGELHVAVSKDLKVTGSQTGGPPGMPGGAVPSANGAGSGKSS
jgi:hypothetical protein